MSFILDALKKAESERHRSSGPVLVDVRIAPRRHTLPGWAWVLGAVLLANLAVLGWLFLHRSAPAQPPTMVAATPPPPAAGGAAPAAAVASPPAATPVPPPAAADPPATTGIPPTLPAPRIAAPVEVRSLPTLQDLQAAGVSLPPLLLNLHVYDPAPAQRYVLLNGVRLAEGEFTPDGIKVVTITGDGVVLEARGRRFLLPAGG